MYLAAVQSMIMYLAAGSPIDHIPIVEHDPLVLFRDQVLSSKDYILIVENMINYC